MKICVTSVGRDTTCLVDPRFGRAAHFLLIDTETDAVHCLDEVTATAQGAGVMVAQSVIDSGASAVVTGQIGPRAYDVLAAAGIDVFLATSATVGGAIQDLHAGRLEKLRGPTAPRHAGLQA
jgi:predicted Fe-Mo cluster-binding NifX family protein